MPGLMRSTLAPLSQISTFQSQQGAGVVFRQGARKRIRMEPLAQARGRVSPAVHVCGEPINSWGL